MNQRRSKSEGPVLDRAMPRNVDAERAVLGAMLKDREATNVGLTILTPDCFHEDAHRHIFSAISNIYLRGQALDHYTLVEELRVDGRLEQIGGASYLALVLASVATSANIEYHAQIVQEKYLLRRLIQGCTGVVQRGYEDNEDVEELLTEAEKLIFEISERRLSSGGLQPVKSMMAEVMEGIALAYHNQKRTTGVATGYTDLDNMTAGLQPSDLIILAARPSVGKTAFALNLLTNIAVEAKDPEKHAVAFFSVEQSRDQILRRIMGSVARVQSQSLQTGKMSSHDFTKINQAAGRISSCPIYLDDTAGIHLHELIAKSRRLATELNNQGQKLGLLVIDYLQLVVADTGRHAQEGRQQEVSFISRSLKGLARELKVPVIAISQLSRAIEKRDDPIPRLADLRESGALEQDADVVMFVHRNPRKKFQRGQEGPKDDQPDDDAVDDTRAQLIIGKQRNGPIGTVDLYYIEQYMRFESRAPGYRDAPAPLPDSDVVPF